MELREIIKILKNNIKLIVVFVALGGLIGGGVVAIRPVKYRGDFAVYLNKAPVNPLMSQNYNDFYSLQSLSNVADFLVEWTKGTDFQKNNLDLKLKKKTALYLEGSISSASESETRENFDMASNAIKEKIGQLNGSIFASDQVSILFSDINIVETKLNFWRFFFAGIFGGFILGVFAVFLKFYFKE